MTYFLRGQISARIVAIVLALAATSASGQFLKLPGNRATRQEALQAIPFADMTAEMQQTIRPIVTKPSVYRRLPTETVDCDRDFYLFLLRNPEVVVNIWDLMGATQIDLRRTGPYTYHATDGAGTTSDIQLVYGNDEIHIFYGEGVYEGSLMKQPVHGRCVLVLRSTYGQNGDGKPQVANVLDLFLVIDNLGVDVLAKTFQPFFGKYADYNFVETVRFLGRMSATAERNPSGMQRLSKRLDKVAPEVREQFAQVSAQVGSRAGVELIPVANQPMVGPSWPAETATNGSPTRRTSHNPQIISRYPVDSPMIR